MRFSKLARSVAQPRLASVLFNGGTDQVSPTLSISPGTLRECQNYEMDLNGGIVSIEGYELFDGQAAPSAAVYYTLPVSISGSLSVGDTVTGALSGDTGQIVAIASDNSYIVLTKVSDVFQSGENLTVSAIVEAATTDVATLNGASTAALNATYTNLAADVYRADISAVTGSGNILGVLRFNSVTYAIRNNAGGTAAVMYKSTSSGWSAVSLGYELSFTSGGTTEIAEGDTITGATSGCTAVVTRVVLESGTWAGGDAAGRFIFASQSTTFQAENINVGASTNLATIAGDSTAIALSPSGSFKFYIENFGGANGTKRVYGCDGVNRGFEFDGTVFVPIDTGMDTSDYGDNPDYVWAHKGHLFFAFGASVQHSGIGDPYVWSPVLGAGEIAVGDTITGFSTEYGSESGGSLGIFCRNSTYVLYGSSSSDWQLVHLRNEMGAYADSIQNVGNTIMVDDRGLINFRAAQEFGNFQGTTLSELIQPWLNARKTTLNCSCISRDKGQYRAFFSDNTALYATFKGNKLMGLMLEVLADQVICIHSVEGATGGDEIFFGSASGNVFQMDKGTSFDGDAIETFAIFNYFHAGSPRVKKKWLTCHLETEAEAYFEYQLGHEVAYGNVNLAQPVFQSDSQNFTESRWDAFTWDASYWDGVAISPRRFALKGSGENIGIILYSSSDEFRPHKFTGATFRFIPRRQDR